MSEHSRLELMLPGTWTQFGSDDPQEIARQVGLYVHRKFGQRDQDATTRASMRRRLREVVETAVSNRARTVLVADEISAGVHVPATITVFEPHDMQVPDTNDPKVALAAVRDGLSEAWTGGQEGTVVEVPAAGSTALRVVTIDEQQLDDNDEATAVRHLRADYWLVYPNSSRVALVACFTPLGDIPHTMVRFFDAILGRARVVEAQPASDHTGASRVD